MHPSTRIARFLGVCILLQMVGGGLVNAVLEQPLFGTPGFLANGAPYATQSAVAVLVAMVTEGLWLAIAVAIFPVLWARGRRAAVALLALATVVLAVAVLENASLMTMVSVSQAYSKASTAGREDLEAVRVIAASARNWAHYFGRIFDGITILAFYLALHRFILLPRAITLFGFVAVALMLTSLGLPFFGGEVIFPLLAPIGLSQLVVAIWLLTKGLPEAPPAEAA